MESTLALTYGDLAAEVGFYLGFGRGNTAPYTDSAWTASEQASIDSCIKSGLRQFYFPPPLEGERKSYDWSFMRPTATVTLQANQSIVQLPDDFGAPEDAITVTAPSGAVQWWTLQFTNEGKVREAYAVTPTAVGRPLLAAVEPIRAPGVIGQRSQLYIYPLADQQYTLQFPYYVNPDAISTSSPYAYGGMQHAETILESCLAIAEQRLDDQQTNHALKFQERLNASVNADRRSKPETLGYNADRSDYRYGYDRGDLHGWGPPIRYNGQVW